MKYAVVFACTAALVSALRLPLPRAADENNQVDKQPAQGQLGDKTKSCEEQGGTQSTICSENQQYINYNGMNGLIACCLPKAAPAQDQKASPESASPQGQLGDETKSCEEQGGTQSTICSKNQQSIRYNAINGLIACCLPKATPTQVEKASPESTSAQGRPGDKKDSCEEKL